MLELRRRDGPNAITPPKQLPEFLKFLKNMVGGFALLLWAVAIMSVVAYGIQQATSDNGDVSNVRTVGGGEGCGKWRGEGMESELEGWKGVVWKVKGGCRK